MDRKILAKQLAEYLEEKLEIDSDEDGDWVTGDSIRNAVEGILDIIEENLDNE